MKWQLINIAPYIGDGSPIAQTFYMDSLTVTDTNPYASVTPTTAHVNGHINGSLK